eukprot:488410_1
MEDFEVQDLNGVEFDVLNVIKLFKELLNYQCFPKYEEYPKLYGNSITWTKKQLMDLLTRRAIHLNENIKRYDGLLVVISSHGWNQQIITSDYKLLSKKDIHRVFSVQYPAIREIPRFFIYDCCDGDNEKSKKIRKRRKAGSSIVKPTTMSENDKGKNPSLVRSDVDIDNIVDDAQIILEHENKNHYHQPEISSQEFTEIWGRGHQNPDYYLATLHAANLDFQSKLDSIRGSYFIQQFVTRTKEYIDNNEEIAFIGEIFKQIQTDLSESKQKQLPEYTWNNGTNNIKFKKKKYNKNFKKKK